MSNTGRGAATGAVQGAGAGAAVGSVIPGVGTLIGGVVGAVIGGVWGAFGGSFGDKAEKKLKKAKAIQRQREEEAYRQQLLSVLRQGRIQRSSALAAAVAANAIGSSSTVGALSSIGSQIANQVEYMSVDQGRLKEIESLVGSAKSLAKRGESISGALSVTTTAMSAAAGVYGLASASAGTTAATGEIAAGTAGSSGTINAMSGEALETFWSQALSSTTSVPTATQATLQAGSVQGMYAPTLLETVGGFFTNTADYMSTAYTNTSNFFADSFSGLSNYFK